MKKARSRRWTVRCSMCVERGRAVFDPARVSAAPLFARALGGSPRFRAALEPFALPQILRTVSQGIFEARKGATEGFTLCPVVTESMRYEGRSGVLRVVFCTSLWTFLIPDAKTRPGPLEDLCQDYFFRVFLPFVAFGLVRDLERRHRFSLSEAEGAAALDRVLHDLSARFPLALHQARYAEELRRTGDPERSRLRVVRKMVREARSPLRRKSG